MRGGARWVTAGLADQVVIASANAGNILLALALLDRHRAGILVLSIGIAYLIMGINRAFVGEVLLAMASRYDGEDRDRLVRNGTAVAVTIGLIAAVVCTVVWAVWPTEPNVDLRDLIWVVPFLPTILLHDTGRYSYLSARQPGRALVIDLVWVTTQGLCVLLLWASHAVTAGRLFVCWGLGATVGACVFLLRSGVRPWRGDPRQWATETRRLSGWFTATALIGQFQVQAVGFLVAGQLSARELSGLRGAQTALIQPVQNFITAMMGLLVPRASRLAGEAARGSEPAAVGLRRQTRTLVLISCALGAVLVATLAPVAHFLLVRVPKFADIAPLALPMSIQGAIYLVQMPFAAALRGMHQARMLFWQYALFSTTSLSGLVIGASQARLLGAVWGMVVGAIVGLTAMAAQYLYAVRRLAGSGDDSASTPDDGIATVKDVSVPR
jgi:hypothetical protein